MKDIFTRLFFVALLLANWQCQLGQRDCPDWEDLPLQSEAGFLWVTTLPAGVGGDWNYDSSQCSLVKDDSTRFDFLPAPFNRGIFPKVKQSGILLANAAQAGAVDTVRIIGTLMLSDRGRTRPEIVCVPVGKKAPLSDLRGYQDLTIRQPAVKRMIEDWYLNRNGLGQIEVLGWKDEKYGQHFLSRQLEE